MHWDTVAPKPHKTRTNYSPHLKNRCPKKQTNSPAKPVMVKKIFVDIFPEKSFTNRSYNKSVIYTVRNPCFNSIEFSTELRSSPRVWQLSRVELKLQA